MIQIANLSHNFASLASEKNDFSLISFYMSFVRKPLVAPLIAPALMLLFSAVCLPLLSRVGPDVRVGLTQLPYYLLLLVSVLGLFLNRTRETGAGLALIIVYFCIQSELQAPLDQLRPGSVYFLISLFSPLIFVFLSLIPEQRVTEIWGVIALLVPPVLFVIGIQLLERALATDTGLSQVWLPRRDEPSILPSEAFYLFAATTLVCLVAFIFRRESSQVGVFFANIFVFATLNWLHLPMISTLMMICAGVTLFFGTISSLLSMLYRDELTGLMNRKALNREMELLRPGDLLVMADIDKFKQLNDTHGHDTGDEVLKLVAAMLSEVRERGKAYRYGGEEFTFIFRGREPDDALEALQEIRKKIAAYAIALRDRKKRPRKSSFGASYRQDRPAKKTIKTSISMGAVKLGEEESPKAALKRADNQLYRAKKAGRNCICTDFRS